MSVKLDNDGPVTIPLESEFWKNKKSSKQPDGLDSK